jgi:hypothetical protein
MIASIELRRVRYRLRAIVALPQMARSYVTRFGFEPVDRRRLLRLLPSAFIEFWALSASMCIPRRASKKLPRVA